MEWHTGTTSACAENTKNALARQQQARELPPRARRIQSAASTAASITGTTSACAENTSAAMIRC